jgi:drug/metabolite transporter (DMT)-like permease
MSASNASLHRRGTLLVLAAALCWSSGGVIARLLILDPPTIIGWRGLFATLALLGFLFLRDGRKTFGLFRAMGLGGLGVAVCFATASIAFVMALPHATIALILVVQSTSPLVAGLIAWLWMREPVGWARFIAMLVALSGIVLMVLNTEGKSDWIGIALSIIIAFAIASATALTRRFSHVRMTPAVCLGTAIQCVFGFLLAGSAVLSVTAGDIGLLFLFGAAQLALGLVLFTTGARLIPAAEATLLILLETVLGSFWVFLFIGENPGLFALYGGVLVLVAVAGNTLYDQRRAMRQPIGAA